MRRVEKTDLPVKICATCNKPMTWRKKWEKNWSNVIYCSERCRSNKIKNNSTSF